MGFFLSGYIKVTNEAVNDTDTLIMIKLDRATIELKIDKQKKKRDSVCGKAQYFFQRLCGILVQFSLYEIAIAADMSRIFYQNDTDGE